jgi:PAS domain S-box-containing protein
MGDALKITSNKHPRPDSDRDRLEGAIRAQKQRFEILTRTAKIISGDLDPERIVRRVADAAAELSGAKWAEFFLNITDDRGVALSLHAFSGLPQKPAAEDGLPRNSSAFEATLKASGTVRSDDIRTDPQFEAGGSLKGLPLSSHGTASYLAVPVGRSGNIRGGLFLAHDQPCLFTSEIEDVVSALLDLAAIAIENAHIYLDARSFRSIVETSDDAIVSKDLEGVVGSWNKGAERLFGYTAAEMVGKSITTLIPADRDDEEPAVLERIRRGQHVKPYETVRMRKDGSLIEISLSVSPLVDADGKIIGASKIARDITAQKQAQARQELLSRELSHRTKNLFAVVQAVVSRSFAGKRTVEEAEEAVLSRLQTLGQTHVLLIDKHWHGADVQAVVDREMDPYAGRVTSEGPTVVLSAQAAQNFALALHELATNAAKYGALSNLSGRVRITWSVLKSSGRQHFTFRWQELGGPRVSPPSYKGFGTTVLEQVMAEYFDAPKIDFREAGVVYEVSGSLATLSGGNQADTHESHHA